MSDEITIRLADRKDANHLVHFNRAMARETEDKDLIESLPLSVFAGADRGSLRGEKGEAWAFWILDFGFWRLVVKPQDFLFPVSRWEC